MYKYRNVFFRFFCISTFGDIIKMIEEEKKKQIRSFLVLNRHIHNLDNIRLSKVIYYKLMQSRQQDDFDICHELCHSMNRLEENK